MVLGCSIISTSTSQKEAGEEAGAARGVAVAARQEDVVHHEAGVVAEGALEVIVVVEALEAAEAQEGSEAREGSAAVVAVAEDLGEVVVASEGHDICNLVVTLSVHRLLETVESRMVPVGLHSLTVIHVVRSLQ